MILILVLMWLIVISVSVAMTSFMPILIFFVFNFIMSFGSHGRQ